MAAAAPVRLADYTAWAFQLPTIQLNVKEILEGVSARRATRRAYEDKKNLRKVVQSEKLVFPAQEQILLTRRPCFYIIHFNRRSTRVQP